MSTPDQRNAASTAFAIGLSVFVGVTSIFTAVMAAGIAPLHLEGTGITGQERSADNAARWMTYALALFTILNGAVALRSGRRNLVVALVCTAMFVAANIALGVLYVRTW